MRAVYVVQAGSYSDRHIIGVCSTQELADRLVELYTDLGESILLRMDSRRGSQLSSRTSALESHNGSSR